MGTKLAVALFLAISLLGLGAYIILRPSYSEGFSDDLSELPFRINKDLRSIEGSPTKWAKFTTYNNDTIWLVVSIEENAFSDLVFSIGGEIRPSLNWYDLLIDSAGKHLSSDFKEHLLSYSPDRMIQIYMEDYRMSVLYDKDSGVCIIKIFRWGSR